MRPLEDLLEQYGTDLVKNLGEEIIRLKQAEWNVRIITAAPEDVDRLYAQAVEELIELGAGRIYEELTALYDQTYGN